MDEFVPVAASGIHVWCLLFKLFPRRLERLFWQGLGAGAAASVAAALVWGPAFSLHRALVEACTHYLTSAKNPASFQSLLNLLKRSHPGSTSMKGGG